MGGAGMFAGDMYRALEGDSSFDPIPFKLPELDITDQNAVFECITSHKPFAVINTVGPLVDPCEDDPTMAKRINVDAVFSLASACQKVGSRFIHLSTCGLFGSEKKFYTENDPVVLKTVYARTKYEGEKIALENCENTLIFRPGWMYGGTSGTKKNFVAARLREARSRNIIQSAMDKFGSPTWTCDAANAVKQLLFHDDLKKGVFNLNNTGGASRAEYVRSIIQIAGLKTQIKEVDSSQFPRKANIPDCEMLDNSRLSSLLVKPLPHWQEALQKYIKEEADL